MTVITPLLCLFVFVFGVVIGRRTAPKAAQPVQVVEQAPAEPPPRRARFVQAPPAGFPPVPERKGCQYSCKTQTVSLTNAQPTGRMYFSARTFLVARNAAVISDYGAIRNLSPKVKISSGGALPVDRLDVYSDPTCTPKGVPTSNIFGSAERPGYLPVPVLYHMGSMLELALEDTIPEDHTIYLTFICVEERPSYGKFG